MPVRIRLSRLGTKKKPFYRIVVCDSRSSREGKCIEILGYYNPRVSPPEIKIKKERFDEWISKGAKPTQTVKKIAKTKN